MLLQGTAATSWPCLEASRLAAVRCRMRVRGRGALPPHLHFKWGSQAAEPPPPGEEAVGSRLWVYVRPLHKCFAGRIRRHAGG